MTGRRSGFEARTLGRVAAFAVVAAFSVYVGTMAFAYYLHRWGIARHHLESAWM